MSPTIAATKNTRHYNTRYFSEFINMFRKIFIATPFWLLFSCFGGFWRRFVRTARCLLWGQPCDWCRDCMCVSVPVSVSVSASVFAASHMFHRIHFVWKYKTDIDRNVPEATSNLRPPASTLRHPASNLPASSLQPATSNLRPPASNLHPTTSNPRHPIPQLPATNLQSPTYDIQPPVSNL